MKHFLKQLSWIFAFVLFFTSIVSTGIPVYASDTITIGEDTNEVIVAGTNVELYDWGGNAYISYYESADSDTVLYEDTYANTIGSNNIAAKPYAWHITFVKKVQDNSGTARPPEYYFKAYPDTSLENVPVSTQMTLPEGITTTATTGAAINISVYIGDTKLTDYNEASSSFTLPFASLLRSYVGEAQFNSALETAGYKSPDLTKLFYTVELTDKSASLYSLKLTLVPTVEVTFDENTGTPDLAGTKMYATPNATIDSAKLPTVSKDGVDFYGWKRSDAKYVSIANVTYDNKSSLNPKVSGAVELKAMYKEINPTFSLDLTNKKVTDLLPGRTYAYPKLDSVTWDDTTIVADSNGEFSYETLSEFENLAQLRLNENTGVSINSDYVSLKHSIPNKPVTENTQTTARVTNTNDFADCEFAIRATSDNSDLSWGTSSTFSGLTPETEYKIYVKHKADENGFESDQAESVAFTTLAAKAVSNDAPNGVTIADIPVQAHTNSAIEPTLVIKDGDKTLVQGTDYTVSYTDNINVGTATATVTFMNSYSGTMTKNFEIAYFWLVSFDGNAGTGAMSNVVIKGQQYTLPACTFTAPANKEFKAWNVGGTEYAAGANCTITDNTTITAVWMDLEKAKTPAISPNGGTFSGSQTVTLTTETTDAVIYYTTNGTTPTTGSTLYSTPFTISSSVTVKAIAVKGGMNNSDIASASFTRRSSDSGTSKSTNKSTNSTPTPILTPTPTPTLTPTPTPTLTPTTTPTLTQTPTYTALTSGNANTPNSNNEIVLTIGKKEAKAFGLDKRNDVAPIIRNDRTMFPVRFVAENLDAEVMWDSKKREVTIKGKNEKGEDVTILIYIESDFAYVNGKNVKLDSHAFIENGRTYTPIRFVAENLGASVEWIGAEKKVVISKKSTN